MTDRDDAIARVAFQCSSATYPVLDSNADIGTLVDLYQRYTIWAPNTSYAVNDIVQPLTPNGFLYRCLKAGTSGPTEPPAWPMFTTEDDRPGLTEPYYTGFGFSGFFDSPQLTDGTVLWTNEGQDDGKGPYNVPRSTYEAWMLKIARASADTDVTVDGDTFNRTDVVKNCQIQAASWASRLSQIT